MLSKYALFVFSYYIIVDFLHSQLFNFKRYFKEAPVSCYSKKYIKMNIDIVIFSGRCDGTRQSERQGKEFQNVE